MNYRPLYRRSYMACIGIAMFALAATVTYLASPPLEPLLSLDPFGAFFRLIDVSPTAELHRLAAVFSTHEATARSLAFAAVAVSALCMTGLFLRSLAARSEVRGLPASIGIAG